MAKTREAPAARRITVAIEGIEGVEKATLELLSGALNILQGRNGIGKTSAARAMAKALGGKVDDLEMRDGATLGTVQITEGEAAGSLVVSAAGRVRTKGEAPITAMDTKALTRLITGDDRVGKTAKDAARIEAFLQIVRPTVDAAAIEILCERDPEMVAWVTERLAAGAIPPDLLSVAERVKDELQRRAREDCEKLSGSLGGEEAANMRRAAELEAQLAELGEAPLLTADLPSAEAAVERLAAEHDERKRSAEERARQEGDREAIRAAGAPRPDVDGALAEAMGHVQAFKDSQKRVEDLNVEIARLTAEREAATASGAESRRLGTEAETRWKAAQAAAAKWDEQQALLASPATGATAEEVEGARLRLEAARSARDAARLSGQIATAKEAAAAAKAAGEKLAARGKQLREWSLSIRDRVADLLAKSGAEGFTVVDGALSYQGNDFDSRLSAGQKVDAAVSLAARFWSGFVFLDPDYFGRLDREHREALDRFCASRLDLIVATEEPTEGALSIVHGTGGAA